MASKLAWNSALLYLSIVMFVVGVAIIGLAFTQIPRRSLNFAINAKTFKYRKDNADMREIRANVRSVRAEMAKYEPDTPIAKWDGNAPFLSRDYHVIRTLADVNAAIEVYKVLPGQRYST